MYRQRVEEKKGGFTKDARKSFSQNFQGKLHSNLQKVFNLPSDSKYYFGFVVDEFSELAYTIQSLICRHLQTLRSDSRARF